MREREPTVNKRKTIVVIVQMLICIIYHVQYTNESLMSFTAVTELQSELFDAKAGAEVISHAK